MKPYVISMVTPNRAYVVVSARLRASMRTSRNGVRVRSSRAVRAVSRAAVTPSNHQRGLVSDIRNSSRPVRAAANRIMPGGSSSRQAVVRRTPWSAGLLEAVPQAERPGVYRRLGDVTLFLTGVFPDYAATRVLGPVNAARL